MKKTVKEIAEKQGTPKRTRLDVDAPVRAGGLLDEQPLRRSPPLGPDGEPLPPWWV